jgi:hypothetical protein
LYSETISWGSGFGAYCSSVIYRDEAGIAKDITEVRKLVLLAQSYGQPEAAEALQSLPPA